MREATGHNDGARVETYLRSVGLPKGQPWCAAFVHFCLTQGGVPNPINGASGSALNQRHLRYYQNHLIAEPQRADVFVIYEGSLGRIGHTGFYNRRVNRSFFETVEGNTNDNGSRDGIGVFRRIRSFHTIYAISSWIN